MRNRIKQLLVRLLSLIPERITHLLVKALSISQGKGWDGGLEKEVKVLAGVISDLGMQNINAVDVGANVGLWTKEYLKYFPSAKITSFEPSKETYKTLVKNFQNYRSVTTINKGCGAKNEERTLFYDKSKSGMASLSKRDLEHLGVQFSESEIIEIITLDSYFAENLDNAPKVIKIDVEGHELDVLNGAIKLLGNAEVVQFEFGGTDIDSRTFFKDFWTFFKKNSFILYRIGPRGLIPVEFYTETDEYFSFTNFIALRKPI
jgi:FkbM family methyltransferase